MNKGHYIVSNTMSIPKHKKVLAAQETTEREKLLVRKKKWDWYEKFHDRAGKRLPNWISFEEFLLTDKPKTI